MDDLVAWLTQLWDEDEKTFQKRTVLGQSRTRGSSVSV